MGAYQNLEARGRVMSVKVTLERGLLDNQFLRGRYTLVVTTQIDEGDTRKSAWEFGNDEPPVHLGWTTGSECVRQIRDAIRVAVRRHDERQA